MGCAASVSHEKDHYYLTYIQDDFKETKALNENDRDFYLYERLNFCEFPHDRLQEIIPAGLKPTIKEKNNELRKNSIQIDILDDDIKYKQFQNNIFTHEQNKGGINGLINLGTVCYFNAVLQLILAIRPLRDYFLSKFYQSECNEAGYNKKNSLTKFLGKLYEVNTQYYLA